MADTVHSRHRHHGRGRKYTNYLRSLNPGPTHYPTSIALAHVAFLTDLGLPIHSIARDAGIHCDSIWKLRHQDTATARVTTALLAVDWHPNERQETVIAVGAGRRLRALNTIGWPFAELGDRIAVSPSRAHMIATRPQATIIWPLWHAIHEAYESISGTPGPSQRAAAIGRGHGWPSSLDWEGHDIDDPRHTVTADPWQPKTFQELIAERREHVAELTSKGLSAAEIADRLGITQRTVVRDRLEHGVAAA